ncbi:MAG TPA: NAD(P)/FAD-dependent oxidoreductase [bacterium]|nr:NAD(P)/FAD-dependent oxidoreductase [bacterium]
MLRNSEHWDAVILGAGGAGLMAAIEGGKRGRRVVVLDHAAKIGAKILISGGGRCNFTNLHTPAEAYVSENPHFCKSALSRFQPEQFISLVKAHGIPFHEKKLGQLFCDRSAKDIVRLLVSECVKAGVVIRLQTKIAGVRKEAGVFVVETNRGDFESSSLVVATGGLSIPKIGATGLGYDIARQFGLDVVPTAPALDGFRLDPALLERLQGLSGVSLDAILSCDGVSFRENILFTHRGLSGPAALQASLYWKPGAPVTINLLPGTDAAEWLVEKKREGSKALLKNALTGFFPKRFAEAFCQIQDAPEVALIRVSDKDLRDFGAILNRWTLTPAGTVGYDRAEVTRGGVATKELSSKTMESKKVPGLYFIGEVVDVTGRLGGYNFQWAWSSGWAAGQAV